MSVKRYARKAALVKTLVSFDGPQVALLKSDRGYNMLAVACEKKGYVYPFFCAEISTKTLSRYIEERIDLNFALRFKESHKRHYFFDWKKLSQMHVPLVRAKEDEVCNNDYYPEPGFFARDHTVEYDLPRLLADSKKTFAIDGKWDAPDFSRFYSKIADIYAFALVNSKGLKAKLGPLDLKIMKDTIAQYAWAGGSSYVSFYSNLFETVKALNPLNISRISYASPGNIEVKGGQEALEEISVLLHRFDDAGNELQSKNKILTDLLTRENLRGADKDEKFSSDNAEKLALKLATELAEAMGLSSAKDIQSLCSDNTLIFVKVILSYYRRGRDLYKFYAEGRVRLD